MKTDREKVCNIIWKKRITIPDMTKQSINMVQQQQRLEEIFIVTSDEMRDVRL